MDKPITKWIDFLMPKAAFLIPFSLILILSLGCERQVLKYVDRPVEKQGGTSGMDGSGGKTIPSTEDDVKEEIKNLKANMKGAFHRLLIHENNDFSYTVLLKSDNAFLNFMNDISKKNINIFKYIDSLEVKVLPASWEKLCDSDHGPSHMAMKDGNKLCISIYGLMQTPREALKLHFRSLAAHEIYHGLGSENETMAVEVQKHFTSKRHVVVIDENAKTELYAKIMDSIIEMMKKFDGLNNMMMNPGILGGLMSGGTTDFEKLSFLVVNLCSDFSDMEIDYSTFYLPNSSAARLPLPFFIYKNLDLKNHNTGIYGNVTYKRCVNQHQNLDNYSSVGSRIYEHLMFFEAVALQYFYLLNQLENYFFFQEALSSDVGDFLYSKTGRRFPFYRRLQEIIRTTYLFSKALSNTLRTSSSEPMGHLHSFDAFTLSKLNLNANQINFSQIQCELRMNAFPGDKIQINTLNFFEDVENNYSSSSSFVWTSPRGVDRPIHIKIERSRALNNVFEVLVFSDEPQNGKSYVVGEYENMNFNIEPSWFATTSLKNNVWFGAGILSVFELDSDSSAPSIKREFNLEFKLLEKGSSNTSRTLPEKHDISCMILNK